jgi:hypothetical protein
MSIYGVNDLEATVINLFYGWGYNFYRAENQLRTDDLLIRSKTSEMLAEARADVVSAGLAYRHEHLPPPTRDNPFPSAEAVRTAQAIDAAAAELTAVASQLHAAPAPENDRMWERHRNEATTLAQLGQIDKDMVRLAVALRSRTQSGSAWILANLANIHSAVADLRAMLRKRGDLLTIQV